MKQTLQPGISLVRRVAVGNDKTISFMGEGGRVYATPYLIGDIEQTCRKMTPSTNNPIPPICRGANRSSKSHHAQTGTRT
jgi:hypothetical protein